MVYSILILIFTFSIYPINKSSQMFFRNPIILLIIFLSITACGKQLHAHKANVINDDTYEASLLVQSDSIKCIDDGVNSNGEVNGSNMVGLDYYFNCEWKEGRRWHYTWEDTTNSGFSELGNLFKQNGMRLSSISTAPSMEDLKKLSVYIIVDPDDTMDTPKPNYIDSVSIENIVKWVGDGGFLMLLANDSANCEFKHLNNLSEKFGIHFNQDCQNKVNGKNFEMGKFEELPGHQIFAGVKKIYLKEISTLKLINQAEQVLKRGESTIMGFSKFGKGFVFAVGDPWIYNEYIDNRRLPKDFENNTAAKNLVKWILGLSGR